MSQVLVQKGRAFALKVVAIQFAVVCLVTIVALYWGVSTAGSIMTGGLISVLPSLLMIYFAFKHSGAQSARRVVRAFYLGELLKLLSTIGLFIAVFTLLPVQPGVVLIGFGLALVSYWLVPFVLKSSTI